MIKLPKGWYQYKYYFAKGASLVQSFLTGQTSVSLTFKPDGEIDSVTDSKGYTWTQNKPLTWPEVATPITEQGKAYWIGVDWGSHKPTIEEFYSKKAEEPLAYPPKTIKQIEIPVDVVTGVPYAANVVLASGLRIPFYNVSGRFQQAIEDVLEAAKIALEEPRYEVRPNPPEFVLPFRVIDTQAYQLSPSNTGHHKMVASFLTREEAEKYAKEKNDGR